ncbi:hypothetical protein IttPL_0055 [Pseudomonas phage ITTPL]|uniref:Uncharacterized protein n=1 Tax=Pseudomonas phage ITTPL TaxID=2544984 RepID=A0A5B7LVK6_9CAUD|nr:hypothetical protein QE324_gp054 [Pseudomonas phage ITTPL]QBP28069.1 hypothetical protein IttPL_0055 [Pseudomonas phage ITTPL]
MAEQAAVNGQVEGSSPSVGANFQKRLFALEAESNARYGPYYLLVAQSG